MYIEYVYTLKFPVHVRMRMHALMLCAEMEGVGGDEFGDLMAW